MIAHQRQPSPTSCGPACVAMLLHRPVDDVLKVLHLVRRPARAQLKTHRTNVGELTRLLRLGARALGDRQRIGPGGFSHTFGDFLLRIDHPTGRGWHWVVMSHGWIFDPAKAGGTRLSHHWLRQRSGRVSAYIVLDPWGAAEVEKRRAVTW